MLIPSCHVLSCFSYSPYYVATAVLFVALLAVLLVTAYGYYPRCGNICLSMGGALVL